MKPITVKEQARLSPVRALVLTLSGMYYRMNRSAITVLILSLAVAFLSYMLSYGIISHDTDYAISKEISTNRLLNEWVSRLSTPDQQLSIAQVYAGLDTLRQHEYRTFGVLTNEEVLLCKSSSEKIQKSIHYFSEIPRSSCAMLVGDADPLGVLVDLGSAQRYAVFEEKIVSLKLKPPLNDMAVFKRFVSDELPRTVDVWNKIAQGQQTAIAAIALELDSQAINTAFIAPSQSFKSALGANGFSLTAPLYSQLSVLATREADKKKLLQVTETSEIRGRLSRMIGIQNIRDLTTDTIVRWPQTVRRAESMLEAFKSLGIATDLTTNRITTMSMFYSRDAQLQKLELTEEIKPRNSIFELPEKTRWLVLVSFLVCVVGIANTMFMSVTDRFSEIATMKCIGAMDGFIMTLFVFEAFFQAVAGSLIGIVLGIALSLFRAWSTYGALAFENIIASDILLVSITSFFIGILIAALAAIAPSWAAARLAPMEAMRVE